MAADPWEPSTIADQTVAGPSRLPSVGRLDPGSRTIRTPAGTVLGEPCPRDRRTVRLSFLPATLPPPSGWAWRSLAGCTGREGPVSRRCSSSSSGIWRSCCESGRPASPGSTGGCARWWNVCCGSSCTAVCSSMAPPGCGAQSAGAACWWPSLAAADRSARRATRSDRFCGPNDLGRAAAEATSELIRRGVGADARPGIVVAEHADGWGTPQQWDPA
jgi:hypothetical protein